MKKELHPGVVVGVLVVLLVGLLGYFQYQTAGKYPIQADSKSLPMPKEAAEGMAKMREKLIEQTRINRGR